MGYFSEADYQNDAFAETDEEESGADASAAPEQDNVIPMPTAQPVTGSAEAKDAPADESEAEKKAEEEEAAKKKAHEEAEAKRKAEFEARQAAKKAAEAEKLARVNAMSDSDVMMAAMKQLGEDAEKLTRRNMKECVTEYIQTMCLEDPAFARKVMHPKKSFVHCIWHINNKAAEFAKKEMEANGFQPERGGFPGSVVNGMYGCDVPDDLVYEWAAEYFNDPNAKEDEEQEEKFVPKPYPGTKTLPKSKTKDKKKAEPKKPEPKPTPKPVPKAEAAGQLGLFAEAS